MGEVIPFPLERRRQQIAAEAGAEEITEEVVTEVGWFGVRLRPEVVTGQGVHVRITNWMGEPVDWDYPAPETA